MNQVTGAQSVIDGITMGAQMFEVYTGPTENPVKNLKFYLGVLQIKRGEVDFELYRQEVFATFLVTQRGCWRLCGQRFLLWQCCRPGREVKGEHCARLKGHSERDVHLAEL